MQINISWIKIILEATMQRYECNKLHFYISQLNIYNLLRKTVI